MTDPLAVVVTTASDAELIAAARAGDAKAYGALYERHAEAAKRLARQIVRRPADVDDVVAETFAKVLSALRRGAGPSEAFRPYLLTAVRRVAFDHVRGQREQIPTDEADLPDPGEPFIDPALASLERSLVARAFRSLPERWSAVLWHTEIEQARAAEVALLLGITPNGVAALSYRAREGLRQAYLQMHLSSRAREECVPVAGKLGAHVRGGLSSREAYRVDSHLRGCGDCLAAHAELTSINGALRNVLGPAVLGGQTAAYLAHGGQAVATASSFAALASRALRWALSHRPVLPVTAGVALTAAMLPVATLVYQHPAIPRPGGSLPRGTAPSGGAPVARASGGPRSSPAPTSPGQPSPGPSGTPAPSGPGSPSPLVSARASAELDVNLDVAGLLNLGLVAVVTVNVSDPGGAATSGLTADLSIPPGTTVLGLGSGSSAWTCTSGGSGPTSCTHAAIAAGSTAAVSFRLLVVSLAGCGKSVLATVTDGTLSTTGESAAHVECGLL